MAVYGHHLATTMREHGWTDTDPQPPNDPVAMTATERADLVERIREVLDAMPPCQSVRDGARGGVGAARQQVPCCVPRRPPGPYLRPSLHLLRERPVSRPEVLGQMKRAKAEQDPKPKARPVDVQVVPIAKLRANPKNPRVLRIVLSWVMRIFSAWSSSKTLPGMRGFTKYQIPAR